MTHTSSKFDRGQSIVIVALVMLGLVALTALALDGGYAYWQRRVAQNAADAGALAGANELCTQKLVYDVPGVASGYVTKNKAQVSEISYSTASKTVSVTANVPFDSFFAGVIGFDVITVTAKAVAKCSPACASEGVLPIAWSCKLPMNVGDDYCDLKYQDEKPGTTADGQCTFGDDYYYIIADSQDAELDIVCATPFPTPLPGVIPDTPTPGPSPTPYLGSVDCDLDDDGTNDLKSLSGGSKAWLDLTGQSGAGPLNDWIQYGFPGEVRIHVWYPSQTGNIGSAYQSVYDYHINEVVAIPIFDAFQPKEDGDPSSSPFWHAGVDDCAPLSSCPPASGAKDYFHIITFGAFNVDCVYSGGSGSSGSCPGRTFLNSLPDAGGQNLKTIEGCFVRDAVIGARGYVGTSCLDSGAYAVQLVK